MTRSTIRPIPRLAALAGLALAAAAPLSPALAQHALDRNLQQGSGGINPSRPSFREELAFRNAVVTGNAPGGMSFRGNVGYRAPGEFFGNLGSNQTFNFRRDSVYSGLGGLGIRGTDALQYQFAMTTGNAPPRNAGVGVSGAGGGAAMGNLGWGGLTVSRSGAGATGASVSGEAAAAQGARNPFTPGAESGDFLRASGIGAGGTMRSPAAYLAGRSLEPTLLGTGRDAQGRPVGITASSLRGIALSPLNGFGQGGRDEQIQPGAPRAPRDPREPDRPASPLSAPTTAVDQRVDTRLDQRVDTRLDLSPTSPSAVGAPSPYDQLIARMQGADPSAPGATPGSDSRTAFQRRLDELRSQLADPTRAPGVTPPAPGTPPGAPPAPGALTPPTPGTPGAAPKPETGFRPETLEMLRGGAMGGEGGGEIRNLAPEGFDAYSTAMKAGQELLAQGRYFDAEARFTTALGSRPSDPLAAIGRINAELGAGMFLSAALNLRTLLTQSPEIVGLKYAPELLPAADRLPAIQKRLGDLLTEREGKDPEVGLLIAYLGYQTEDAAAITRGLTAMNTAPEGDSLRRLAALLRQVWTKPAPPSTAPATAPASGPNPSAPPATAPPPAPGNPPPPAPNK